MATAGSILEVGDIDSADGSGRHGTALRRRSDRDLPRRHPSLRRNTHCELTARIS
jgi:hypothetical protein